MGIANFVLFNNPNFLFELYVDRKLLDVVHK